MAKKKDSDSEDIVLSHLEGFARKGARVRTKANVPTGHFDLDFAMHYGELPGSVNLSAIDNYDPKRPLGLPMGRTVEFYGPPGGGKSSLAYRVVGNAQRMNHPCLWIDTEHSFSEHLAEKVNGVDLDSLYYSELFDVNNPEQNFTGEDVFDNIIAGVENGVKVVVLDSLPNLIPKERMEKAAEKVLVARLARLGADYFGKVVHYVAKNDALFIVINHIRTKPGIMFGPTEDSPGGWAIKHNFSIRLCITMRASTKEDNYLFIDREEDGESSRKLVAKYSYVGIKKNKIGKPLLDPATGRSISIDIPIYYEPYFPNIEEILFNTGRSMKLIGVRKGVYTWNGHKVEGKKAFIEYVQEHDLVNELGSTILETSAERGIPLPPELLNMKFSKKKGRKSSKKSDVPDDTIGRDEKQIT